MKLHLNTPESDKIIEAIKCVLGYKDAFIHVEDYCDATVGTFVWDCVLDKDYDWTIKNIALYAYNKADSDTIIRLEGLRFIGDGACPNCGSDRVEQDRDFFELGRCQRCLQVFQPERYLLTFNGVNYWQ